ITKYLKNLLKNLWPAETTPPMVMEIKDPRSQEFMSTGCELNKSDDKAKKQKSSTSFFICFTDCLSE
uniref:hypothetical protein n=1 Tax=Vibrio vulnificus TaxID=672 RepID=UPI0019D4B4D0